MRKLMLLTIDRVIKALEKAVKKYLGSNKGITTLITLWEDDTYAIEIRHASSSDDDDKGHIHRFIYQSGEKGLVCYYRYTTDMMIDFQDREFKSLFEGVKPKTVFTFEGLD